MGFAGMMANPSADGWERACFFDKCQRFFKFPFGSQIDISLDIDVGRALRLAGGGLLFFGAGFIGHGVAAGALVIVVQNDAGLRVLGDGIFGTGEGTVRLLAMVAKQGLKIGCFLNNPDHPRTHSKSMFLLAGDFTRMAAAAIFFVEFY
jgi:hypothetical protein